jgi:hypothetical protein
VSSAGPRSSAARAAGIGDERDHAAYPGALSHGEHEPQFGKQPDQAGDPGQRAGDVLTGGVRGALAVGLVPGHDVPGHQMVAGQAGLIAQAEEIGRRVVVIVGGGQRWPCGQGFRAGTAPAR